MDGKNLKHRTVIEIRKAKDISQEPEMERLNVLVREEMTDEERERTAQRLKEHHGKFHPVVNSLCMRPGDRQGGVRMGVKRETEAVELLRKLKKKDPELVNRWLHFGRFMLEYKPEARVNTPAPIQKQSEPEKHNVLLMIDRDSEYGELREVDSDGMEALTHALGWERDGRPKAIALHRSLEDFDVAIRGTAFDLSALSGTLSYAVTGEHRAGMHLGELLSLSGMCEVIKEKAEKVDRLLNAKWVFQKDQREARAKERAAEATGNAG